MSEIDKHMADEIGEIVDNAFEGRTFWSHVVPRDPGDADWAGTVPIVFVYYEDGYISDPSNIPIIGAIDSDTGVITHHAPLPEPPAPLTAENYAAGRMPFAAWLVGALGIGVAVAIAAVMVLADRVRKGGAK